MDFNSTNLVMKANLINQISENLKNYALKVTVNVLES